MLKKSMIHSSFTSMMLVGILATVYVHNNVDAQGSDRIRPYEANPYFWQYKGEPILLLGGSWQDNLFNHPEGLEAHLDLLASVGGNYVRNTMSSRTNATEAQTPSLADMESGAMDNQVLDYAWAFARDEATGLYDLNKMGEAYWERFANLLKLTAERDIIVQIELFDRFDYARLPWQFNPFNPRINNTYTTEESGLPEFINTHPGQRENPFFRTVPDLENNTVVLPYQQAFLDKLLSISLPYGNVLYCISNETNESEAWGAFWAQYIRNAAEKAGVEVHVTEMWDSGDLMNPMHLRTINHPERYTFIDISQNNSGSGMQHWTQIQYVREMIQDNPRPLNNVKIYTFNADYNVAIHRWWRNILGGSASARFHRPHPLEGVDDHEKYSTVGLGLSPLAQAQIRSARYIMNEIGWPNVVPDLDIATVATDEMVTVHTEKTHLVYTRDADGLAQLYINGELIAKDNIGGDLTGWDASMRLALGSELTGDRNWRGTYHELALYDRALDASEINEHFHSGVPEHLMGIHAHYRFNEGGGTVIHDVSGQEPSLDLHIADTNSIVWSEEGLQIEGNTLIATTHAATRLTAAFQDSNALTLEAWITPALKIQSGPAQIVTISTDQSSRNFTVGQMDDAYQVRLRTTATSVNGIPALHTYTPLDVPVVAARSLEQDRAAIFVPNGVKLVLDSTRLHSELNAYWYNPHTSEENEARISEAGYYLAPTAEDWILLLR